MIIFSGIFVLYHGQIFFSYNPYNPYSETLYTFSSLNIAMSFATIILCRFEKSRRVFEKDSKPVLFRRIRFSILRV